MIRWNFRAEPRPSSSSSHTTSATSANEGGTTTLIVMTEKDGHPVKSGLHRTTVDSIAYVGEHNNNILSKSINGRIEYWEAESEKIFKSFHLRGSAGNNYCRLDLRFDFEAILLFLFIVIIDFFF
jgi:hypothetical protein